MALVVVVEYLVPTGLKHGLQRIGHTLSHNIHTHHHHHDHHHHQQQEQPTLGPLHWFYRIIPCIIRNNLHIKSVNNHPGTEVNKLGGSNNMVKGNLWCRAVNRTWLKMWDHKSLDGYNTIILWKNEHLPSIVKMFKMFNPYLRQGLGKRPPPPLLPIKN